MKPRLILIRGIWHCGDITTREVRKPIGIGYSPAEAWEDWFKLWRASLVRGVV